MARCGIAAPCEVVTSAPRLTSVDRRFYLAYRYEPWLQRPFSLGYFSLGQQKKSDTSVPQGLASRRPTGTSFASSADDRNARRVPQGLPSVVSGPLEAAPHPKIDETGGLASLAPLADLRAFSVLRTSSDLRRDDEESRPARKDVAHRVRSYSGRRGALEAGASRRKAHRADRRASKMKARFQCLPGIVTAGAVRLSASPFNTLSACDNA